MYSYNIIWGLGQVGGSEMLQEVLVIMEYQEPTDILKVDGAEILVLKILVARSKNSSERN